MTTNTLLSTQEIIEFNPDTGEILVSGSYNDFTKVQQTKIKALRLLTKEDFVRINGTWEAKRDALIKILSSLPISYSWQIKEKELNNNYAQVMGVLSISSGKVTRSADSMGICEFKELKGNGGLHFMNTRAETRALKRAIEVLFGSVINYYVVHYLN
jgi:hypothetical protein